MHDVELGVVAHVEVVRIQRAGSIQRVGVRVDIEVALNLTVNRVDFTAQGTGSALLTVRCVGNHVQRQVVQNLVRRIQVSRVTLHLALLGPTRIRHHRQGGVVVGLLGTAGGGNGVVVLDGTLEQEVEPVGVAVFGGLEVSRNGFGGVLQTESARGRIILGNQLVHLAVDTAVHAVCGLGVVEVTFLLELLVDGHLVLGVHDVEGGVRRLQPVGVLAGVADVALARLSFLRGNDDNARHCARAIYRGSGSVFQDIERFDIVGVQAGDGGRNQGSGVTGGKVVGTHVHHIFHDHAIDHPQRFGRTVDGGGAADTDLGGRTESTGNVLHGHAGHLAFQGTADIGNTAELGFIGIDFGGGTGHQPAVHLLHTRCNGSFQHFGVVCQGEIDGGRHRLPGVLEAQAGGNDILGGTRHIGQGVFTVHVGHGTDGSVPFHKDGDTGDGFPLGIDHRTAD